jgi:hypothetical protein
MSLRGTLGDFGLADIFQLIGHQAKTGVLLLKHRDVEVRISFVDGNVVKAERGSRDRADLLGNLMVRAGVVTEAQLASALQTQQRTTRRLGDILVDSGAVTSATLKEFTRLQTTETIYRIFESRAGTYEFNAQSVDVDSASHDPIRSESILMEGFRMVDEWPSVRRAIPSLDVTLQVLRAPPPPGAGGNDAHGVDEFDADRPPPRSIGDVERRVFTLVTPGCSVGDVVDRSRLGELEASKALATLVHHGVLGVGAPAEKSPGVVTIVREVVVADALAFVVRCVVFVVVAALVGGLVRLGSRVDGGPFSEVRHVVARDAVVEQRADVAAHKLRAALAVARVENGRYPLTLDELVVAGLILPDDLTAPYETSWGYRAVVEEDRYELAPPLR